MLVRAARIGREEGLHYIYAGNLPGEVGDLEDTRCHACGEILVGRYGYLIQKYRVSKDGCCPRCTMPVPGRWAAAFERQLTAFPIRVSMAR
jgi:pyruvate formate lyase activating enzyme